MNTEITLQEEKKITPAKEARIKALAGTINFDDPALTVTYGTKAMTGIAQFADTLLARVRAKDAGPVGETLADLMVQVKGMDMDDVAGGRGGVLEKLPVIGSLFNRVERSLARFSTLAGQVEAIAGRLETAMHGLLLDIEVLEQLYAHNVAFHDELSVAIEAGKKRLEEARAVDLPRLQQEAEASADTMAAQQVRDFAEKLNRFERRLHDLQLSRTITLQTAPQIRLIQGNNQTLAEKIQTSILSTIPIWKSQMILALSLHGQHSAAALQKSVADTTNDLLKKNADMLEKATVSVATEAERSIVDVETVREVHAKLLSTIEETLRIAEEGRTRRVSVEKELVGMEQDLRQRLTSLASRKSAASLAHAEGQAQEGAPGDGAGTSGGKL